MKTEIFAKAIHNRNRVQILYEFETKILEPYCISRNRSGKKVIYGRLDNASEIKMIEYDKILNIKILNYSHFSPIIPILN